MVITGKINVDDDYIRTITGAEMKKKKIIAGQIVLDIVGIAYLFYGIWTCIYPLKTPAPLLILLGAFMPVIAHVMAPKKMLSGVKRAWEKELSKSYDFVISETGIIICSDTEETFSDWQAVSRAVTYRKNVVLYMDTVVAITGLGDEEVKWVLSKATHKR